jgi:cell division protein FtsW
VDFINKMFRGDRVVWIIFTLLCLISIVEVYSASSPLTFSTDYWKPIMRHTNFLLTGALLVLGIHAVKPKYFALLGFCLPFACLLLIATKMFGKPVNESYRWFEIAGIRFQPSEIAKLCLIVFTAFILGRRKDSPKDQSFRWIAGAAAITCGIIFPENASTAILLASIVFFMMFIAGVPIIRETGKLILHTLEGFLYCLFSFVPEKSFPKIVLWKKHLKQGQALFLFLLAATVGTFVVLHFIPDKKKENLLGRSSTWEERIANFNSEVDIKREDYKITDYNFQPAHGCIAIANGGIIGHLPGNGQERNVLPQAFSDYIYSIIIEETGLIGGIIVIGLYLWLSIRAGIIANRCDKVFLKILVLGAAMLFVFQALSNIAVAVHLIPVTGQPLPLISRGGTSTWINCIYIGILLSVSRYENPAGARREKEITQELEEEQKAALETRPETENEERNKE